MKKIEDQIARLLNFTPLKLLDPKTFIPNHLFTLILKMLADYNHTNNDIYKVNILYTSKYTQGNK